MLAQGRLLAQGPLLAQGRLLVPVLHGQAYLDKPPLLYWLVMGSYRLFGVHDWAARLVPGLAGVLTVLVVYLWGSRTVGGRAGHVHGLRQASISAYSANPR